MSDEVDILDAGNHESFLNSKFAMSLQYIKKEVKTEVDFLHAEFPKSYMNIWSIKVSYKVNITLLTGMITCFQMTQSNKFAISLQYLKKEVRNGDHFWHADKRQSFCKSVLSFLMEVARHVPNAQNRKLVTFLQLFRKNVATALCSIVM